MNAATSTRRSNPTCAWFRGRNFIQNRQNKPADGTHDRRSFRTCNIAVALQRKLNHARPFVVLPKDPAGSLQLYPPHPECLQVFGHHKRTIIHTHTRARTRTRTWHRISIMLCGTHVGLTSITRMAQPVAADILPSEAEVDNAHGTTSGQHILSSEAEVDSACPKLAAEVVAVVMTNKQGMDLGCGIQRCKATKPHRTVLYQAATPPTCIYIKKKKHFLASTPNQHQTPTGHPPPPLPMQIKQQFSRASCAFTMHNAMPSMPHL